MIRLKTRNIGTTKEIFDFLRRKWLVCTPEEEVRQWFLSFLIQKLGYYRGNIAIEHGFEIGGGKKFRTDIVVFNSMAKPLIVVECKAPHIKLDIETFRQASKYNSYFKARYIVLTNGDKTLIFKTENFIDYSPCDSLPSLQELLNTKE